MSDPRPDDWSDPPDRWAEDDRAWKEKWSDKTPEASGDDELERPSAGVPAGEGVGAVRRGLL